MTAIASPSSFLFPHGPSQYAGSDNISVPRPILPRPQEKLGTPSLGPGLVDRQAKRPRTNVTIACDGCKHARAKCDGENPCLRCGKRSLSCSYNQGNDRRQNRGTSEEVQALNERLVQYQKLVFALRSSTTGNAGYVLQQLRSASTEAETFMDEVNEDAAFVAAVQLLNDKSTAPPSLNREESSELVGWIKNDMDGAASRLSTSPTNELPESMECNAPVAGGHSKRGDLGRLLC